MEMELDNARVTSRAALDLIAIPSRTIKLVFLANVFRSHASKQA